ncbi:MAG TPA: Rrf2 family transcriptional regulator [Bacteroidales bacterium]|jgi:Rrf2 family protein|nr:Rrf2 family transcriptional regulator [Bacteroidales bacterium]
MLSNTSKYAIRAMIYLAMNAGNSQKTGIKKISSELSIPAPFLAKILQILARHKLLSSSKGPNGGFSLSRDARKIMLFEIVTVIDGSDIFDKCLISLRTCNEENIPCPIHHKYEGIRNEIKQLFQQQDIGNLANDIKAQQKIYAL